MSGTPPPEGNLVMPAIPAPPTIPGRTIIQIAAISEAEHHSYGIFALCSDGSLWELFYNFGSPSKKISGYWETWSQIPNIPQPTNGGGQ